MTTEQQREIDRQARYYDTPECPCDGLISHRIYDPSDWGKHNYPAGSVAVDFTYRYEDDGSPGLETTVFAPDGTVVDSQDFG